MKLKSPKIAVLGPPHSGKTVFINYIYNTLPSKSVGIRRTAPDGEGVFTQNPNQEEIQKLRRKGTHSPQRAQTYANLIKNDEYEYDLVDVGGKITKENYSIMKECTHAIIVSNNPEDRKLWEQSAKECRLSLIASLDSSLDGKDEIYENTKDNVLRGKVTNLVRGHDIENSELFDKLIENISKLSIDSKIKNDKIEQLLRDKDVIDINEIAKQMNKEIDKNEKVMWDTSELPELIDRFSDIIKDKKSVKIYNSRATWMVCGLVEACKQQGIEDISFFDASVPCFNEVTKSEPNITQNNTRINNGALLYNVLPEDKLKLLLKQNENDILMYFDINPNKKVKIEDQDSMQLPDVDPNKSLYITGKLPAWLLAHITNTYDNKNKYIMQLGNYFIKSSSENKRELGQTKKEIEDIPYVDIISKYIKDTEEIQKQ